MIIHFMCTAHKHTHTHREKYIGTCFEPPHKHKKVERVFFNLQRGWLKFRFRFRRPTSGEIFGGGGMQISKKYDDATVNTEETKNNLL